MLKEFIATIRGILFCKKIKIFNKSIVVGEGLKIYKKLHVCGDGKVQIGKNCSILSVPGDNSQYVTIDTHDSNALIVIGDDATLSGARISSTYEISIGDDFLIEESGVADTDYHSIDKNRGEPENENREKCRIRIGNRVSIGAKSFITKGVTIGNDAVVMPGSIVSTPIKEKSVVLGNPAKEKRGENK